MATLCPIALRTKIRTRHNIAGSIVYDCCTMEVLLMIASTTEG